MEGYMFNLVFGTMFRKTVRKAEELKEFLENSVIPFKITNSNDMIIFNFDINEYDYNAVRRFYINNLCDNKCLYDVNISIFNNLNNSRR